MLRFFALIIPFFLLMPLATAADDGVSPYGYTIFNIGIPVTNAFITSIVIASFLVLVVRRYAEHPTLVPNRGQAFIETVFEGIMGIMEPIVGKKMVRPAFPLIASLFLFILLHNWSGLLPGVGAFGFYDDGVFEYLFRPANTDINNTIALAIAAHIVWLYLIFKHAGIKEITLHIFGNKADKKDVGLPMWLALMPLFIVVGFIELVSIAIRPLTLSARLFGNIYGGESMLEKTMSMAPPWVPMSVPFYFLEVLVGFVQAMVFCLLVSVYIGLLCNHDEEHH